MTHGSRLTVKIVWLGVSCKTAMNKRFRQKKNKLCACHLRANILAIPQMPEMPVASKQSYTGRRLTLILCNTNLAKKLVSTFEKKQLEELALFF